MSTWHNRQGGDISHLVDDHGEILATVIREGSAYNPIYIIKGRLAVVLEGRIFISMQAAQSAVKPEPAAPAAQGEEVVDRVAKAIADAAGHGMREKCEHLAHAAIAAYKLATWGTAPPAQPAERVPEGMVLVPREPTEAMRRRGADRWIEANENAMTRKDEEEAARCAWAAMLAASPAPSPARVDGGEG